MKLLIDRLLRQISRSGTCILVLILASSTSLASNCRDSLSSDDDSYLPSAVWVTPKDLKQNTPPIIFRREFQIESGRNYDLIRQEAADLSKEKLNQIMAYLKDPDLARSPSEAYELFLTRFIVSVEEGREDRWTERSVKTSSFFNGIQIGDNFAFLIRLLSEYDRYNQTRYAIEAGLHFISSARSIAAYAHAHRATDAIIDAILLAKDTEALKTLLNVISESPISEQHILTLREDRLFHYLLQVEPSQRPNPQWLSQLFAEAINEMHGWTVPGGRRPWPDPWVQDAEVLKAGIPSNENLSFLPSEKDPVQEQLDELLNQQWFRDYLPERLRQISRSAANYLIAVGSPELAIQFD